MEKETLEEASDIERIAMDKLKNKWGHLYTFRYPQRPFPTNYENDLNNIKIGLYEGAKWQAERMYSEEDMINFANFKINNLMKHVDKTGFYLGTNKVLEIWKEEFKKK